jgi:hypothetical protein
VTSYIENEQWHAGHGRIAPMSLIEQPRPRHIKPNDTEAAIDMFLGTSKLILPIK